MKGKSIVVKFGGAAFSRSEDFLERAKLIQNIKKSYDQVVVVVSAMANMTTSLLRLSENIHPDPPKREQDMLITVGERISMSLLAMALDRIGLQAVSFTGSQSGIITCSSHFDAKILDVKPYRIVDALKEGKIVIVAGFQGVSLNKEVTTLGRGGSDTTAVALGIALKTEKVQFYKDVLGVYLEDPKRKIHQKPFSYLNYNQALAIVQKGARILHPRSLLLAKRNSMPLCVSTFLDKKDFCGTSIYEEGKTLLTEPIFEKLE